MAKYRKLPVVIDAIQLTWETWTEVCEFCTPEFHMHSVIGCYVDADGNQIDGDLPDAALRSDGRIAMLIRTLEGNMIAVENDWIIRGVNGELYPCKPDIFAKTYETAEDALDEIMDAAIDEMIDGEFDLIYERHM